MHEINTLFVVTEMRLGGREKVTKELAEELNKKRSVEIFSMWVRTPFFQTNVPITFGDGIVIKTPEYNNKHGRILSSIKQSVLIPVAKRVIPYSKLQFRRLNTLSNYINDHKVKNVILTDLTITFAPFLKKQFPKLNLIGWVHMDFEHFFNKQYKDYKKELLKGFKVLNHIVTLTDSQARDYAGLIKKKVISISNPMPSVSKYVSNLSKKNIIVVSRIDIFHKGLDMLLEVTKMLPEEWKILFVGEAQTIREAENFQHMITNQGLENKIDLLGPMQGHQLDQFYSEGSMFLMTSRYEGFPLTLGEAMAHGLPIISFRMDGSKEITNNGEFGVLVDMGDIESMGNEIQNLIMDKNKMKEYSKKGMIRVSQFSLERIASIWNNLLKDEG